MELQNDPSFERRGIMQTMHHPVHRPFKMPGWPVRVDGKPSTIRPSPVLGQHSDDVLADWLGLNADEIGQLRGNGALG
jgi:crotonobetainyl-CoA:carnitine CoA-transferase CaiB-like acyl-CoA transferase